MKRWLWRLLVFVLAVLPLVALVGHPWAVAAWGEDPVDVARALVTGGPRVVMRTVREKVGEVEVYQTQVEGDTLWQPALVRSQAYPAAGRDVDRMTIGSAGGGLKRWTPSGRLMLREHGRYGWYVSLGYGWPFVSLAVDHDEHELALKNAAAWPVNGFVLVGADPEPGFERSLPRALPWRVAWLGLLGNLALYGAVCWGLGLTPLLVLRRRAQRRRWARGECGRCGYALAGLDVCSECGAERPTPRASLRPA